MHDYVYPGRLTKKLTKFAKVCLNIGSRPFILGGRGAIRVVFKTEAKPRVYKAYSW
ncbi:MAG: hypothetical protein ACI8XV_000825 [Arenicella sp.]|jgi:hypothetical protein